MHRTEKSHANVLAPMARTIFPPHGLLLAAHFTAIPSLWAGRFQRCHRAWGSNVTSCPLRPKFWAKSFQWCLLKYAKVGQSDAMMQNPYAWRCMALTWLNNTLQAPNETEKIREVFHRHQWSPWDPWASPTLELLERQRFWRVLSVLSRYWVYWGGVQEFSFMRGLAAWHSLTCWQYLALSCTIVCRYIAIVCVSCVIPVVEGCCAFPIISQEFQGRQVNQNCQLLDFSDTGPWLASHSEPGSDSDRTTRSTATCRDNLIRFPHSGSPSLSA